MVTAVFMAAAWAVAAQGAEEAAPPQDHRMESIRNTDTVYTMPVYESVEKWEAEKEIIRRRILLGSGLYPLPEKTPLNEHISGKIEREGYSIEKVYFEAWPGFLVTGNLYRPNPLPADRKIPAVLCPHGHWEHGRLENTDKCSVPGRCITLARMGATVFAYDMVGYNDSIQFSNHRFLNREEKLWGISPYALQLWSSIRAVDFVQGLPEVDPERIGCTGASGGGTQTFSLYAVDDRIKVAAPVNMISCSMQGGCVCENGPLMRQRHNNMEIGATMAPRPLLMISATGDWTKETPRVEYPAIKSIYALYGAEDKIEQVQIDAGHNYNKDSREAMYRFFAKHLLGLEGHENFTEPAFEVEPDAEMLVFPDRKLPEGFLKDQDLIVHLKEHIESQRAARRAQVNDEQALELMQEMAGCSKSDGLTPRFFRVSAETKDGREIERWQVGSLERGEQVPLIFIRPANGEVVDAEIFVGHAEQSPWVTADGALAEAPEKALAAGHAAVLIDLFGSGVNNPEGAAHWAKQGGAGFNDTFVPVQAGIHARELQLVHEWAMTRRDLGGMAQAHPADGYSEAVLHLVGVPQALIAKAPERLAASALEDDLYIPAFLTLFQPSDLGLN